MSEMLSVLETIDFYDGVTTGAYLHDRHWVRLLATLRVDTRFINRIITTIPCYIERPANPIDAFDDIWITALRNATEAHLVWTELVMSETYPQVAGEVFRVTGESLLNIKAEFADRDPALTGAIVELLTPAQATATWGPMERIW